MRINVKEVGFGIAGAALIFLVYFISVYKRPCNIEKISIPYDNKDSKIAVAEKIMEKYFKYYKNGDTCPNSWIKTYKINSIETNGFTTQENNQFKVNIDYSIKPTKTTNTFWLNDGKKIDGDGWINNKLISLTIGKNGDSFELVNINK